MYNNLSLKFRKLNSTNGYKFNYNKLIYLTSTRWLEFGEYYSGSTNYYGVYSRYISNDIIYDTNYITSSTNNANKPFDIIQLNTSNNQYLLIFGNTDDHKLYFRAISIDASYNVSFASSMYTYINNSNYTLTECVSAYLSNNYIIIMYPYYYNSSTYIKYETKQVTISGGNLVVTNISTQTINNSNYVREHVDAIYLGSYFISAYEYNNSGNYYIYFRRVTLDGSLNITLSSEQSSGFNDSYNFFKLTKIDSTHFWLSVNSNNYEHITNKTYSYDSSSNSYTNIDTFTLSTLSVRCQVDTIYLDTNYIIVIYGTTSDYDTTITLAILYRNSSYNISLNSGPVGDPYTYQSLSNKRTGVKLSDTRYIIGSNNYNLLYGSTGTNSGTYPKIMTNNNWEYITNMMIMQDNKWRSIKGVKIYTDSHWKTIY